MGLLRMWLPSLCPNTHFLLCHLLLVYYGNRVCVCVDCQPGVLMSKKAEHTAHCSRVCGKQDGDTAPKLLENAGSIPRSTPPHLRREAWPQTLGRVFFRVRPLFSASRLASCWARKDPASQLITHHVDIRNKSANAYTSYVCRHKSLQTLPLPELAHTIESNLTGID